MLHVLIWKIRIFRLFLFDSLLFYIESSIGNAIFFCYDFSRAPVISKHVTTPNIHFLFIYFRGFCLGWNGLGQFVYYLFSGLKYSGENWEVFYQLIGATEILSGGLRAVLRVYSVLNLKYIILGFSSMSFYRNTLTFCKIVLCRSRFSIFSITRHLGFCSSPVPAGSSFSIYTTITIENQALAPDFCTIALV